MRITKHRILLLCVAMSLCGLILHASVDNAQAQRKFVQKECLECHTKFADKYFGMKTVHAVVKDRKCQECHLRHGLIPKLILKKEGNELCYGCHSKEKIGMNKSKVHTALRTGKCTLCHNPHASPASHLLNAEGSAVCYQCHNREDYEKKVVHQLLKGEGCRACHFAHSSDQNNLPCGNQALYGLSQPALLITTPAPENERAPACRIDKL